MSCTAEEIWEKVWGTTTVEEQLTILRSDEYFEHINNVIKKLPRRARILEAGCGLGRWVFYLDSLGFETVGLDIVREALKEAIAYGRIKRKPTVLVRGDVLNLPFRENSFDLVLSLGVIEHFKNGKEKTCIKESFKVLKNFGLLFVSVPNKYHFIYILLRGYSTMRGKWRIGFERSFSIRDLKHFLEVEGFLVQEVKTFGFKYATTHVILGLSFLWPLIFVKGVRIYFYDKLILHLTKVLRAFRLFGFYACVIGRKLHL